MPRGPTTAEAFSYPPHALHSPYWGSGGVVRVSSVYTTGKKTAISSGNLRFFRSGCDLLLLLRHAGAAPHGRAELRSLESPHARTPDPHPGKIRPQDRKLEPPGHRPGAPRRAPLFHLDGLDDPASLLSASADVSTRQADERLIEGARYSKNLLAALDWPAPQWWNSGRDGVALRHRDTPASCRTANKTPKAGGRLSDENAAHWRKEPATVSRNTPADGGSFLPAAVTSNP